MGLDQVKKNQQGEEYERRSAVNQQGEEYLRRRALNQQGEEYLRRSALNHQGEETVISLMGPGSLIGDLAVFSTLSLRTVDVVSLTPMTFYKLRHRALQEAMNSSPAFIQALACLQACRLCSLGERLMLMNENAKTRLLATLSLLARLNGPNDDPYQPIPALSQQEIAVISGLSRGTASTPINKLRGNGTLEQTDQGLRFTTISPLQRRGLLPRPESIPLRG